VAQCQILCRSVKPLRRYGRFLFFKVAAFRHLGFLKFGNFNCPYLSEGQNAVPCQILCRSVKPLRKYGGFLFSRWRSSAILDFQKLEILTAHTLRRAKTRHRSKSCANRSRRCGDMAVFVFFKIAAVRHLEFLKIGNFTCPHPSEGQSASSCQILCKSVKALRRYGRFDFSRWRPSAILDF